MASTLGEPVIEDLTGRARVREAATGLLAERGVAVTASREITGAGVAALNQIRQKSRPKRSQRGSIR